MKLLNGDYCKPVAQFETVFFELNCNYFNEWFYSVDDVMKDDSFQSFEIGTSLRYDDQKKAYEEAARYYNTLVPDEECIPLF